MDSTSFAYKSASSRLDTFLWGRWTRRVQGRARRVRWRWSRWFEWRRTQRVLARLNEWCWHWIELVEYGLDELVDQLGESVQRGVDFEQCWLCLVLVLTLVRVICSAWWIEGFSIGIEELRRADLHAEDSSDTTRHRGELPSGRRGSKAPRSAH